MKDTRTQRRSHTAAENAKAAVRSDDLTCARLMGIKAFSATVYY